MTFNQLFVEDVQQNKGNVEDVIVNKELINNKDVTIGKNFSPRLVTRIENMTVRQMQVLSN